MFPTTGSWLWVFLAPELKLILFEFDPTRAHHDVTLLGCLVHIRRGFQKAQKQNKTLAAEVLTYFNIIYKIEAYADKQKLDDAQRLALRQKYTKPFLDKIKAWLLAQQAQDPVQGTPIAKAIPMRLTNGTGCKPVRA